VEAVVDGQEKRERTSAKLMCVSWEPGSKGSRTVFARTQVFMTEVQRQTKANGE